MVLAVASANGVFWIVSTGNLTTTKLLGGAILMGLGIAAMHYTGMRAMGMEAVMSYNTAYVLYSVLIAILTSGAALLLAFNINRLPELFWLPGRLMAAFLMGMAICGMHFTGMKALGIKPFPNCIFLTSNQPFHGLTTAVIIVTGIIFGVSAYLALKAETYARPVERTR
jgi:diguanylate cyclase